MSEDLSFTLPPNVNLVQAVTTIPMHDIKAMSSDPYFIHTAVLPTLNVTLFEALVTDPPICSNALDCIHADANHVNNIVEEISTLTQNKEIYHASFAGHDMIYRVSYGGKLL